MTVRTFFRGEAGTPRLPAQGGADKLVLDNQDLRFEVEQSRVSLARKQAELQALAERNIEIGERLGALSRSNENVERELAAVYASTSWFITRPLRALVTFFRRGA